MKTTKQRRDQWRADGKCTNCGRERAEGYLRCQRCLDTLRAQKARLKGDGKCHQCLSQPAREGSVICEDCAAKTSSATQERTQIALDEGRCVTCRDAEAVEGNRECRGCADRRNALSAARTYQIDLEEVLQIQSTPCNICGDAAPSHIDHCDYCEDVRGPLCQTCNANLVAGLDRLRGMGKFDALAYPPDIRGHMTVCSCYEELAA